MNFRELLLGAHREADSRYGEGQWLSIASHKQRNRGGVGVPLTAFPFGPEMIADILLGGLVYVSFISGLGLMEHIERRGWDVVNVAPATLSEGTFGSPVFLVSKVGEPDRNYAFTAHSLVECGASLLDVDSILAGLEKLTEGAGGDWVPVYEDEASLWR